MSPSIKSPNSRSFLAEYARVNGIFTSQAVSHIGMRFKTRDGRLAIIARMERADVRKLVRYWYG